MSQKRGGRDDVETIDNDFNERSGQDKKTSGCVQGKLAVVHD